MEVEVLPPSPMWVWEGRDADCVLPGDTGSGQRWALEVGSCLSVPLELSREPRKEEPWEVVREELGQGPSPRAAGLRVGP